MRVKEKCFICQKNEIITEEHYIVPVREVKKLELTKYENEVTNLCPNCHTYLHLLFSKKFDKFDNIFCYFKTPQMRIALAKLYSRYFYIKAKNKRCKNAN